MRQKKKPIKVGEGIRQMALRNKLKRKNNINNDFLKYLPETEEREIQRMIESSKTSVTDALEKLIKENCLPLGFGEIGVKADPCIDSEIRVKLNSDGSGYMHVMNRDSSTIDFQKI